MDPSRNRLESMVNFAIISSIILGVLLSGGFCPGGFLSGAFDRLPKEDANNCEMFEMVYVQLNHGHNEIII